MKNQRSLKIKRVGATILSAVTLSTSLLISGCYRHNPLKGFRSDDIYYSENGMFFVKGYLNGKLYNLYGEEVSRNEENINKLSQRAFIINGNVVDFRGQEHTTATALQQINFEDEAKAAGELYAIEDERYGFKIFVGSQASLFNDQRYYLRSIFNKEAREVFMGNAEYVFNPDDIKDPVVYRLEEYLQMNELAGDNLIQSYYNEYDRKYYKVQDLQALETKLNELSQTEENTSIIKPKQK